MDVIKTIICDITGYSPKTVDVAHNDRGSRRVACRLFANGAPWIAPEQVDVSVSYSLPDGTLGLYKDGTAMVEGNTVTVGLSDQILSASGTVSASVVLEANGDRVATFPFLVRVIGGNSLTNAETYPVLGEGFEGNVLFGGSGGKVIPLTPEELNHLMGARVGGGHVASDTPPEDTSVLWIDTSEEGAEPDSWQNVIDEVIIPSQTIEVDLLPLFPAENKVMSTSGDNIVFYNNDGWRTVFIPVESSKTYRLVYIGSQYTTFRHAFLDENKTGLAVDYHLAVNVTNEQPVIFTAKNNGYYAVSIQAPDYGRGSIQFLTEVETGETIEYVLSSHVKLAAEHVAQVVNDGLRVSNVAGKKLGVIGDSITFGTVNLGETRLPENERWWGEVKARYGFAEVEWNAEVGRAFTRDGTMSTRFTQKVKELSNDLDVIIVFGGVNDRAFNADIGTMDDEPKEDNGGISFCSSLRFTAEYLLANHPNARIIFMTPLPCNQSLGFNGKNEAGYRLQDYADAVVEMCRAYGFDLVDLNRVGGFYVWSQNWLNAYMEDGIHPNKAGTEIYVKNGILPKLDTIFFDR